MGTLLYLTTVANFFTPARLPCKIATCSKRVFRRDACLGANGKYSSTVYKHDE